MDEGVWLGCRQPELTWKGEPTTMPFLLRAQLPSNSPNLAFQNYPFLIYPFSV